MMLAICRFSLLSCQSAVVTSPGECYYNTLLCCDALLLSSVVSHAFSALCMYSKFGHHAHPIGYLCAKFDFCRGLNYRASPQRKIAYSVNHSIIQLIWCPGNRSFCFGKVKMQVVSTATKHICESKDTIHTRITDVAANVF